MPNMKIFQRYEQGGSTTSQFHSPRRRLGLSCIFRNIELLSIPFCRCSSHVVLIAYIVQGKSLKFVVDRKEKERERAMEVEREKTPPPYAEGINDNASMTSHSMGSSSKRTMSTRQSKKKVSAQEQALALSMATSQAAAAAKSILMSGGREETALLTAKAAAESVLLDRFSVFSSKRQAKQQAQVVASMALISAQAATNQFPIGAETNNIFMQTPPAGSFSGSRKSKPPSVIRQTSTSRREDLSSVGVGESFTDLDESVKQHGAKALVKNARSNNSSHTNTGQIGGLPPTHPTSSPKSVPSQKKKTPPRNDPPHTDKGSPMSAKTSRTNGSPASDDMVVHLPGRNINREVESSDSKDSYFARRRAREQEKKKAKKSLVVGVPDEDPIYDSTPQLDLIEEQSATFDSDDHSRSAAGTTDDEDDDEEKSVSSDDAFESVDLKKPKEPVITFGGIVDGMFCGACNVPPKRDHRDDGDDMMSGEDSHTDDSSREDIDEPISPVISPTKKKWHAKSPRALSPHTRSKTDSSKNKMRKQTPRADPVVILSKDESIEEPQIVPVLQKPEKEKQTNKKTGNNKSKKKAEVKKKIKESMEKVVLRAMAAGDEKLSLTMSDSMTSKNEDHTSHADNRSLSSKASRKSRGSRLSNWIRRKQKK